MLYAVFNGHGMFIALATLLSVTVGFVVHRSAPPGAERRALKGLFAASVTAVVSLTLWSTGSPVHQPRMCVVNRDLVEPFTTDQGLLNAGLFLPVGLLGVLATRKVLGSVAFGVLLTFSIETLQGSLTFLGRGCDSSDLVMNSLGVVTGALAGWAVTAFERPRAGLLHPWRARSTYAAMSTVAALALVWGVAIEPQVVDRTLGIGRADAAQEAAIRAVVDASFDGYYKVSGVDFASGPDGTGTVMAQFSGGGSAELRWPGRDTFQAYLDMTSTGRPSGYPLPGATASPVDERQAQEVARAYAARHAAWGVRDARPRTTKVDEAAELGWMTSWRRYDANGVLMPMRLDVQVDRGGLVTQIVMTNIPDPRLSSPRVRKKDAVEALLTANERDGGKGDGAELLRPAATAVLLAMRDNGTWIPAWRIEVPGNQPVNGSVNALTGAVIDEGR
ncbi:VanZ family protein [Streptomyces sp. NPDC093111]|uniref:VanZ family protein n=1 Tax=Streptomyces sp. NPDC093111 TaxID=3154978 RepID=UPI0034481743